MRRVRRGVRRDLSRWLARRRGTYKPIRAPLPAPRRILVCRINARLGNILFLTPLLRSLAASYPDAEIDVLLRVPAHAGLLAGMPGVRRIHVLPNRLLRLPGFLRSLRRRHYDLAIDPNIHSSGNRIALALCAARYRLGFAGPDQWLRLTHAAARPAAERHQARQALDLLTEAIDGPPPKIHRDLGVYPGTEARLRAERLLREALGPAWRKRPRPLMGFFVEASGPKRLPAAWWRRWHAALERDAFLTPVQVLAPGEAPLIPAAAALGTADLDVLAAAMARMDLFVAADSGPMHLAAAAGVPVIGLFTATEPADYAPLGRDCLALTAPLEAADVATWTREYLIDLHESLAGAPPPSRHSVGPNPAGELFPHARDRAAVELAGP